VVTEIDVASTSAVEDYAKAIYSLEERCEGPVATGDLAARLGVTPGSASAMSRRLAELGLATYTPYRGVELTGDGRRLALEVLRHHRLLELYLAEHLGIPWDRVHEEAEILEHVLSEDLEARIAAKLGDPSHDPHGDPIPTHDGTIEERTTRDLGSLEPGEVAVFTRVSDSDPEKLRHLSDLGIAPGVRCEVLKKQPFGGGIAVRFGEDIHQIAPELASAMRVEDRP